MKKTSLLEGLLLPAAKLMNSLTFARKIGLLGFLFLVPLLYIGHGLYGKYAEEIAFAQLERAGVRQSIAISKVLQPVQQHRGLSRLFLSGDKTVLGALDAASQNIESALAALQQADSRDGDALNTRADAAAIKNVWKHLGSTGRTMSVAQNRALHNDLIDKLFALLHKSADNSNLTLDPELDSFYLMDAALLRLPMLVENLGQARAVASAAAKEKVVSLENRIRLAKLETAISLDQARLKASIDKISAANPNLKTAIGNQAESVQRELNTIRTFFNKEFLTTEVIDVNTTDMFNNIASVAKTMNAMFDASVEKLDGLLASRIARTETRMRSAFAVLGLMMLATIYLFIGGIVSIKRSINTLSSGAQRLASGDVGVNIALATRDELDAVGVSFQKVQATLKQFLAAQQEMGQKHEAGMISYRIPVEQFQGAYAQAARQTNELAQGHLDTQAKVIEIAGQYAVGNLAPDMPALPGEKVVLTNAMVEMKSNLSAINAEILKLADAAKHGDFTVRGDAERFDHDFKAMVNGLNDLMGTCHAGLGEIAQVLAALARGDLTHRAAEGYEGTFGEVIGDSIRTSDGLADIINKIKEASQTINVGSQEIAAGNLNLSQRTEEQASSLQETASSMEELTQTVKQNAENSKQANQLAIGASQVAVKGGEMVAQVVGTMASINESSKKIVDIISVIDGIAFQTNILALNAAVEAARAGEQGRGFAVVASEVRNLAQRSASAAKEIKSLIGDSVDKVETGTKLVEAAGATMGEIVTSVKRVSDIIAEITAASQEQSSGIEQVGQAITQMDQVTQQNAALVEQAAAAAESMRDQAAAMAQTVSVFVVDGSPASPSNDIAPKPAPTNGSGQ